MKNRGREEQERRWDVDDSTLHEGMANVFHQIPRGVFRRRNDTPPGQGQLFDPDSVVDRTTAQRQSFDDAVQRDDVWFHWSKDMPEEFSPTKVAHVGTLDAALDRADNQAGRWEDTVIKGGVRRPARPSIRAVQFEPEGLPVWEEEGDEENFRLDFMTRAKGVPSLYINDAEDMGSVSAAALGDQLNVIGDVPVGPLHKVGEQPSMFLNEHGQKFAYVNINQVDDLDFPRNYPTRAFGKEIPPNPYPPLTPRTEFHAGSDDDAKDNSLQTLQFRRIGGRDYDLSKTRWQYGHDPGRKSFPRSEAFE